LHLEDDMGEALGVSPKLVGAAGPQLGRGIQTA
jgi:hypothetical protein